MKERNIEEAIIDRVLLLYLLYRTRQKGYNISGNMKLQKMLYKAEERMFTSQYKGFNYNFVRWGHGPFSQEICLDMEDLKETGFLQRTGGSMIDLSEDGLRLIRSLQEEVLAKNRQFERFFETVINEFGAMKGREIKAAIYSYPKVGERKSIREAKRGETVLQKLEDPEAANRFWIDEKWLETLSVLFDPKSHKSIKEGLKALREEEGTPFIPVLE